MHAGNPHARRSSWRSSSGCNCAGTTTLRDYDVAVAEGINTEPVWPTDKTLRDLLRLGFADKIIASPEHPYVKQLRGLAD